MPQNLPSDKTIVLHHIDKLYDKQSKIWESVNRIVLGELALSILIIAISSGVLSLEENFEVTGLKVKTSLTVILSGGATLLFGLLIALFTQVNHAHLMRDEIKRLYESLDYHAPSSATEDIDAFETPSFYFSLMIPGITRDKIDNRFVSSLYWCISIITLFGLGIVLPLTGQIAAGLKVMSLFGWQWWISVPFTFLIGLTIIFFLSDIITSISRNSKN